MENTYKIRIYTGRIETKYGVDITTVIDDPVTPIYDYDEVKEKLMEQLGFTPAEDDTTYPGYDENDVGAYFDYDGYIDVDIPHGIVERIRKGR